MRTAGRDGPRPVPARLAPGQTGQPDVRRQHDEDDQVEQRNEDVAPPAERAERAPSRPAAPALRPARPAAPAAVGWPRTSVPWGARRNRRCPGAWSRGGRPGPPPASSSPRPMRRECGPAESQYSRGSRTSRRPSPARLNDSASRKIARPGQYGHPRRLLEELLRGVEHRSPRGRRRLHAEAEERQHGLGDDRGRDRDGGLHQDRADDVGQDVARHHAHDRRRRARGPRARSLPPCRQHEAPGEPDVGRRGAQADGQRGVGQRGAQDRDEADGEDQKRKGQPGVGEPHDRPDRARRDSSRRTRPTGTPIAHGQQDREHAGLHRDARCPTPRARGRRGRGRRCRTDAPSRRLADLAPVRAHRIAGRHPRRAHRHDHEEQHDDARRRARPGGDGPRARPGASSPRAARHLGGQGQRVGGADRVTRHRRRPRCGCADSARVYDTSTSRLMSTYDDAVISTTPCTTG